MAMIFPSIFRANVEVGGSKSLSVSGGGIGAGISATDMAGLSSGDIVAATKMAVGASAVDGLNDFHVAGAAGVTGDATIGAGLSVGTSASIGTSLVVGTTASIGTNLDVTGNASIGVNLDVTTAATIGSKMAVGAAAVDGTNDFHVIGAAGITQHVLVGDLTGANVSGVADGDIALGGRLLVGDSFNAANVGAPNDLYVQGDATIATDLHIGGDLYLSSGIQIPQLQSEIVTLDNTANRDTPATGVSLTGASIPNAGMLIMMVASNDHTQSAPSAAFIAAKPSDGVAGVVTTLHSGASAVNAGTDIMQLEMVWNSGDAKPALHYTAHAGAGNDGQVSYGVTTLISSGPTPS